MTPFCSLGVVSATISIVAVMVLRTVAEMSASDSVKPRSSSAAAAGAVAMAVELEQPEIRPIFKPMPRNITVGPGDRAVLKCRVDNLGTKTVTWKRYNDVHPLTIGLFPFAPDTRISVDYNQRTNEWSLIIQDVRPMDEGIYQCQISTKNEHDTYDIKLNVKNILVHSQEYFERGSTIELTCNATGKPEPPHDVEWFKGDQKINSDASRGIIITKKIETKVLVSILVIRESKLSDSGEYTCQSSNGESETAKVQVVNVSAVEKRGTNPDKPVRGTSKNTASSLRSAHLLTGVASLIATAAAAAAAAIAGVVGSKR